MIISYISNLGILLFFIPSFGYFAVLDFIYALALFLPSLAVTVRRLHDTDRSGWWVLIGLIPFVGTIWLLVLLVLDGSFGPNRFGANPKEQNEEQTTKDTTIVS